jgi:pimeloyl-ACP methyl ester carboxylesterase
MSRDTLITGSSILLGSYLAATCLTSTEGQVFLAHPPGAEDLSPEEFEDLIRRAAARSAPGSSPRDIEELISGRLRMLPSVPDHEESTPLYTLPADGDAVAVWCLDSGTGPLGQPGTPAGAVRDLLNGLPELRATEFNYVKTVCGSGVEREVVERCNALGIGQRVFRTSLVIDATLPLKKVKGEGFLQFLSALHSLKSEIEERLPEYFEYQALRCHWPAAARVNLIDARYAAESMLRIARNSETLGGCFNIAHPESVPIAELCERVGAAYDVSLLPVESREELNAIDLLFNERLARFHACVTQPEEERARDTACCTAGSPPALASFDAERQLEFLRAVRGRQDEARNARDERVAGLPGLLERKVISSGPTYYAGGSGAPAVVLLNALGQGLYYWYRLIEKLMRRRRVIIWEPRGLDDSPRPFCLDDHVDDLEAILKEEGVNSCHLVGWCTGPKVAVKFYLRHPDATASMVFLNCSFKHPGSPPELDTAYERNLESLCRVLSQRPKAATSVRKALTSQFTYTAPDLLDDTDPGKVASEVLSMMSMSLREHVLGPFRSDGTLSNYSRQILDFITYDAIAEAKHVRAPVLLVSCEYDKIASPDMSSMAAGRFPDARHVRVQGASHYCLYDRPDLVAGLIETFFQSPEAVDNVGGEVRLMTGDRSR